MPEFPKSIKNPTELLQQSRGTLKTVYNHAQTLLAIETVVCNVLDSHEPGSVRVASYKNGLLHLVTHSAALATRIKYSQRLMIATLRHRKKPFIVKTVKVSIKPEFHKKRPIIHSATPPSAENAQYIADAAKYIEDEPLRKALIQLSAQVIAPK